ANFIELLLASNVPLLAWAAAGLVAVMVVIGGVVLYRQAEKWTDRYPYCLKLSPSIALFSVGCLFLFMWESSTAQHTLATHFETYEQTLPWKSTLMPQRKEYIALDHSLKEPKKEEEFLSRFDPFLPSSLSYQPDIYLFVVESLREDFITQEIAPQLHHFKRENTSFDLALSNANA